MAIDLPSERRNTVIGPFVGPLGGSGLRICLGLPDSKHDLIVCSLRAAGGESIQVRAEPTHGDFRLFQFEFGNLAPDSFYDYSFSSTAGTVDIEGLEPGDLRVRPIGNCQSHESFVLLSCHNPFKDSSGNGWAMWKRLGALLKETPSIRLLLLGGDQVYNDEVEVPFMARLASQDGAELMSELRRAFITNYQKFWGDLSYRRVLAQVPSLAMWDDHDITDGWGGRSESFDEASAFHPHWRRYFDIAREAFAAYQAVRNPAPLPGSPEGVFTTSLDWGPNRFYLCDFRSEKNSHQKRFWSEAHDENFCASLTACTAPRIFVLSPVVPFRTDPELDAGITWLTKIAWNARNVALRGAKPTILGRFSHWLLDKFGGLSGLTDDLEDALMAECNREPFVRLLDKLFDARRRGCEVAILSGDIHCAGVSEFLRQESGGILSIPQVVSSPIAYEPMSGKVEGSTTAAKQARVAEGDGWSVSARNGPYISDRNFVVITPDCMDDYSRGLPLSFHFENHRTPMALPMHLSPLPARADASTARGESETSRC